MGHLGRITYPPSPLINVGKYGVFSNKKRKNHLIINIESGGGENLLRVPTLLSGIVGVPHTGPKASPIGDSCDEVKSDLANQLKAQYPKVFTGVGKLKD